MYMFLIWETSHILLPKGRPQYGVREFSYLRYGLGKFYGIEGKITHYHNWYDRVVSTRENGDHIAERKSFLLSSSMITRIDSYAIIHKIK